MAVGSSADAQQRRRSPPLQRLQHRTPPPV
jgi:hypothetical protein